MKIFKILPTTLFFVFVITLTVHAQSNTNMIECPEYGDITYNGKTIDQLNTIHGNTQAMQQAFGNTTSIAEQIEGILPAVERIFFYNSNEITFGHWDDITKSEVVRMEIKEEYSWPVVIKGHTIYVGDTEASLKQKFGQDLKMIPPSALYPYRAVCFNCDINSYDGMLIFINPITEKITQITYYVNP